MKNFLLIISIGFLFSACALAPTTVSTPIQLTDTSIPAKTVTPTTVWFPPTATHTAFPTQVHTPTADMRPNLGTILYEDDFSSPAGWSLTHTEAGSVAYGKDELTIAIGETNAYLFSVLEQPAFGDFYLEITAGPSMCRDFDEYGVLFRVSPASDYYRFSLSCNGQVRLDRIISGQVSSPH